jgi:biotin operon repressor
VSIKEQIIADFKADLKNRYAIDDLLIKYKKHNISYVQLMHLIGDTEDYKNFDDFHNGNRHSDKRTWSEENIQKLIELYKGGESYAEIACRFGTTEIAINAKIARLRSKGLDNLSVRKGWNRHGTHKTI